MKPAGNSGCVLYPFSLKMPLRFNIYIEQAPLTEELVFRACMISLLLCGGFGRYTIIIIFPLFFSLGKQRNLILITFVSMSLRV